MTLRNVCIEFDPGMAGKGVLRCCMTLRNVCIEFDPGMAGKGVLRCCMTSLCKWSTVSSCFEERVAEERLGLRTSNFFEKNRS